MNRNWWVVVGFFLLLALVTTSLVSMENLRKEGTKMAQEVDTCVKPAAGPLIPKAKASEATSVGAGLMPMLPVARVGKEAPDFEASAYIPGEGFKNVKLSDYRGKWVVLCFYPGDFTFV